MGLPSSIRDLTEGKTVIRTKKQILELKSLDYRTRRTCGNGLLIVRDPRAKNGGLYFCGTMQRKVPGGSKPLSKDCWIGIFGDQPQHYTLQEAHTKWNEIKKWSLDQDRDPADFYKQKRQEVESRKTLKDAVDLFLSNKAESIKETTLREYRLKLNNQVHGIIPPGTLLKDLEWSNGGREIVMNAVTKIANGSKYDLARRCQKLLYQVFNCAISRGWMNKEQNPAERLLGDESPQGSSCHHKSIEWDEVPELLARIKLNRSNTHVQAVLATKLMLMTFLRAGALSRLEWEWVQDGVIRIPGTVSGLKRRKGKHDSIPHLVPITPQIQNLLDRIKDLNCHKGKYVFQPIRKNRFSHLDPSAPNNFLKGIGYDGELVAHGWRRVAKTTGIDVLKADPDVIDRQMGHLPKGKVNQAYDGSTRLEERRDFLEKWKSEPRS